MLKHYVFFTFEDGYYNDGILDEFLRGFAEIRDHIDGVKTVNVQANCVDRPGNMQLMVEMGLTGEDILSEYLQYPTHVKMCHKHDSHIVKRFSFDYEC